MINGDAIKDIFIATGFAIGVYFGWALGGVLFANACNF